MTVNHHVAVKFRAYPTRDQATLIDRTIGCVRLVYNLMLETRIAYYQDTWQSCDPKPALYKNDYPFLKEVDSLALCNAQLNLRKAYNRFFKDPHHKGFPKYKAKHYSKQSYTTNNVNHNIQLNKKARKIKLPKIGWLAIRQHKTIPDDWKLKSVTVEHCKSDKYMVTILFEHETQMLKPVTPVHFVGLDYSSSGLFVSSDSEHANYPKYSHNIALRLVREQRKLAHMVKNSNNYHKQRCKIARLYEKTVNRRLDWQHKLVNHLVDMYDVIAVEDINMTALAVRPKPKPDPNHNGHWLPNGASAKTGMAKNTMDNAFGQFRTILDYKLKAQGKQLIRIEKWFPSSQLCSVCGYQNKTVKNLSIREWTCPRCLIHHDRDVNAAINLRKQAQYHILTEHNI